MGEILKAVTLNPMSGVDELRRAISLNPNNAEAYSFLAFAFSEAGFFKEAETTLVKARELDPSVSVLLKGAWSGISNYQEILKV